METLRYEYKPNAMAMVFAAGFFAFCAVVVAGTAQKHQESLIINGIIKLNPDEASFFNWGMAAVAAAMSIFGVWRAYRGVTSQQKLVLGEATLSVPKTGLQNTLITIPYATISAMQIGKVRKQRFLIVQYAGGKVNIASGMLPSQAIFEKVCHVITDRVMKTREQAQS